MSISVSIVIGSPLDIQNFAEEINSVLKLALEDSPSTECWYVLFDHQKALEAYICRNLDELGNSTTAQYEYILEVYARLSLRTERDQKQIEYAQAIFNQLKATGKYPMLLMWEYTDILDEFNP